VSGSKVMALAELLQMNNHSEQNTPTSPSDKNDDDDRRPSWRLKVDDRDKNRVRVCPNILLAPAR